MGTRPASSLAKRLKAYSESEKKIFHSDYAELEIWNLVFKDGRPTSHWTEKRKVNLINTHDASYYGEAEFDHSCILMKVTIYAQGQTLVKEEHRAMKAGDTYEINVTATME